MENPEYWNLLTSSLATNNLNKINETWAFLVLQGLVEADDSGKLAFNIALEKVNEEGEITGPSIPQRVASELQHAGVATKLANISDPWGKIAKSRLEIISNWINTK